MKQKEKEVQLQKIPLQEETKASQRIVWDCWLTLLLLTGLLLAFTESWGQPLKMGFSVAAVTGVGFICSLLAQWTGRKSGWIKGGCYAGSWLVFLIFTGFRGYLTGFFSWINAIITGWNLAHEGGVRLFSVQETTQGIQAFTLAVALLAGEGILVLVKKKQRMICAVMVTTGIVIQLLGNTYSPVACGFLLAGFCGICITGKKTWVTENMVGWTIGLTVFLCVAGIFSKTAAMESVEDFRGEVEETVHEVRYGEKTLPEGDLYQAGMIHAGDQTMLEVTSQQEKDIYLRGFVGGSYQNGQWKELPDASYSGDNAGILAWLKKRNFDPLTQVAQYYQLSDQPDQVEENQVQITVKDASRYYIYAPVSYAKMITGNVGEEKDTRLKAKGIFGSRSYRWEEISGSRPGELTIAENWVQEPENDKQKAYQEAEAVYREFVYDTYTSIDSGMQQLMNQIFWADYETDSDGIYSALDQIRKCLNQETVYTEEVPAVPEGEDPIRWFLTEGKAGNDVYYAAASVEAFRAYGIPARYVEGYYLSANEIQAEASGTNTLTGRDAHAWVEVYFDGVGWLPLDTTPGYYYDTVSLQKMISTPDQVSKNAALEDPSFEANQATDTESTGKHNLDTAKRIAVHVGAVVLGCITLLILLLILFLGLLEIGRILDYEWMHRKYERISQKEKVHMLTEEMQKLLAFLGVPMSLGWKTKEVEENIRRRYPKVEEGTYQRVCQILEKSIYGQMELEAYEMRTIAAFMKKLEEIGRENVNWKGRLGLRYGYVARITGKIRRKIGQKRKTEKKNRKRIDKRKGK